MEVAEFVRRLASDMGVVADAALDKRIRHKFTDLAWKKNQRDGKVQGKKAAAVKRKIAPTKDCARPAKKGKAFGPDEQGKDGADDSEEESSTSGSSSDDESESSTVSSSDSESNDEGITTSKEPKGAVAKYLVKKAKTPEQIEVRYLRNSFNAKSLLLILIRYLLSDYPDQ